jgi:hypothetical protein
VTPQAPQGPTRRQAFTDDELLKIWHDPRKTVADLELLTPEEQQRLDALTDPNRQVPVPQTFAVGPDGQPIEGSAVERFAGGAWKYLNPFAAAKFLGNVVAHPEQTGRNIIEPAAQHGYQAVEAFKQGKPAEALLQGVGTIPLVGPPVLDAIDRVRAGDVAGGAGELFGIAGPALVRPALAGTSAVTDAVPALGRRVERTATRLNAAANERVANAMTPKVGANKIRFGNLAEKIAPQLLEQESSGALKAWTLTGLRDKIAGALEDAQAGLDAVSDARNAGAAYPTAPILEALLARRRQLTAEAIEGELTRPVFEPGAATTASLRNPRQVPTPEQVPRQPLDRTGYESGGAIGRDVIPAPNRARVAMIDQAIADIKVLGPMARYESLRRIRQAYDGPAKAVYAPAVTSDYMVKMGEKLGAADATGTLRDALATFDPATAAENAKYHLYKSAYDVLEAAHETERARPKVGRTLFAGGMGALSAGKWGVPIAIIVDRAVSELRPGLQLRLAVQLNNVAKAVRKGRLTQADNLMRVVVKNLAAAGVRAGGGSLPSPLPGLTVTGPK